MDPVTVTLRPLRASTVWDGTSEDKLRDVAGEWLLGVSGGVARIRKLRGGEVEVPPGWAVAAFEGAPGVVCCDPGAWETMARGQP